MHAGCHGALDRRVRRHLGGTHGEVPGCVSTPHQRRKVPRCEPDSQADHCFAPGLYRRGVHQQFDRGVTLLASVIAAAPHKGCANTRGQLEDNTAGRRAS